MRITNYTAHAATQGQVHNGATPGVPHCQRPQDVDRRQGMKAYTTFPRSPRIIVLYAETSEYFRCAIIHTYWDTEMVFSNG
jgi:hypothetical protein